MSLFLSSTEMIELTGKKQRQAQANVLLSMGINYMLRPDGYVLVKRSTIESLFMDQMYNREQSSVSEPDWSAL